MTICDGCGKEYNAAKEGPFEQSDWRDVKTRYGSVRVVCPTCFRGLYFA
ncbi:hypothetical protein [Natronosalvus rutilus]|uniref:Uncharacterized protein n=1 Tax=Natronosalvus rutilus TaxID=2953753 RepID=A0A9E7NF97_9EURY|nr:hypothetical protein [Natronosalvus rutilus]UTF55958.1 hypothetical protein NGM29_20925 [Natronosalvus rutilus]